MSETATFIKADKLKKTYRSRDGSEVDAIEAATFDIRQGEFISIVGPSGCGKSTLMNMVAGLLAPSSGSLKFDGFPEGPERPRLGMVFQDAVLLPWRTVLKNVLLPLEIDKGSRTAGEGYARELIKLVGLQGFEGKYPFELSGGMQQRASIARALVNDPALLLMDEPFAALDALMRESMAQELQRIWSVSRKTVLFITHSIDEAVFLSDRIIVMTTRPSQIREVITVPLERPRTIEMTSSTAYIECVARVKRLLFAKGEVHESH
ncbi:MAG: ABC transporter ATP-binding protein [Burkholderiaceae bacterium]|nr:ABC transporter ATP-binding protein [Burkholderiaceae bacterium]